MRAVRRGVPGTGDPCVLIRGPASGSPPVLLLPTPPPTATHPPCLPCRKERSKYDYDEMMRTCRFMLAPRGDGLHSFRLLEATSCPPSPPVSHHSMPGSCLLRIGCFAAKVPKFSERGRGCPPTPSSRPHWGIGQSERWGISPIHFLVPVIRQRGRGSPFHSKLKSKLRNGPGDRPISMAPAACFCPPILLELLAIHMHPPPAPAHALADY